MLRCLPLSHHCCQSSVAAGVIVTGGRTVASHASYTIGAWDPVAAPGMPKEGCQKLARQRASATDVWRRGASAAKSTGGEGAQKGGGLGGASRTCARARARAVTRSSSCTIANVCTITNVQLLHPSERGHTDSPLAATARRQEQGRVQGDQEQGDQEQGDQEQDQERH